MSSRDDSQRLSDILGAIATVENDLQGMDEASFLDDGKTQRSVLYSLSVIGEAAAKLSPET